MINNNISNINITINDINDINDEHIDGERTLRCGPVLGRFYTVSQHG